MDKKEVVEKVMELFSRLELSNDSLLSKYLFSIFIISISPVNIFFAQGYKS